MPRFFIPPDSMDNKTGTIKGPDAKHIIKVLRYRPGDRLILFDGKGFDYDAKITRMVSGAIELDILIKFPSKSDPSTSITLAQALLKDRKMDDIIRQATELGISAWLPFPARRSVSRLDPKRIASRMDRWHRISTESLKQCGRSRKPEIKAAASFEDMLLSAEDSDVKIIFWEEESPLLNPIQTPPDKPEQHVFAVIGPEGGFTKQEIDQARAAGFQTASLGPRILKADTATLAACTLIQFLYGDMG